MSVTRAIKRRKKIVAAKTARTLITTGVARQIYAKGWDAGSLAMRQRITRAAHHLTYEGGIRDTTITTPTAGA